MLFTIERKIVLAFGITLAALVVMVAGARWSTSRFQSTSRWVTHTHQVLYEMESLLNQIKSVQIESQRFVITADPAVLERWNASVRETNESYRRLLAMIADNAAQTRRFKELRPAIDQAIALTRERNELRQASGREAALAEVARGRVRQVVDDITQHIEAAQLAERGFLATRTAETESAATVALAVTIASSAVAVGLASLGLYLALRDLAARKRAEEELERFFTLTHDLLCIADFDGHFTRLNPAWEKVLGYTTAELLARPYTEYLHPDDLAKTQSQAARQSAGLEAMSFENRYRCKDGSYRWLEWNARPIPNTRQIFATARDITLRKRVEHVHQQFRALFESLPGLYLVLTPDLKIVAASDAYLQATMRKREELLNQKLFDAFPDNPADNKADGVHNLRASLDRVRRDVVPDTMAVQKYDIARHDGSFEERYWSPINSPVLGADGELEYIIHRVEDVTEFVQQKRRAGESDGLQGRLTQMEAEVFRSSQQLQAANRQLHEVNSELEAFSYSVSHDLRAPLRHIDGFASLLSKHAQAGLDEKSRRYVDVISEAARKMGRLIDDLLEFSRAGRTEMKRGEIDQNALVAEVIRDGRFDQTAPGVEWKIGPMPMVNGDRAMLRQVWFNYIDNAVKYSGKTSHPVVEIGFRPGTTAGEQVFYVRDNGAGFDMKYVGKLFGVFQRLHTESEFAGTGIGLANVRRIVARHGGRVWAESSPGEGSVFYFSLPAASTTPA